MIFNIDTGKAYKTPTLNSSYPADVTVAKHTSVTCKVEISADGYPTYYTYQWYKNGVAVSGATSSSYSFTPTTTGVTTVYCAVTSSAGVTNSREAKITATNLYLYNRGNECTSVTGGWVAHGGATLTKESNGIKQKTRGANDIDGAKMSKTVDLKNFSTLHVVTTGDGYGTKCDLRAFKSDPSSADASVQIATAATEMEMTLDVSGLSGAYNILIRDTGVLGQLKFYEVWLS